MLFSEARVMSYRTIAAAQMCSARMPSPASPARRAVECLRGALRGLAAWRRRRRQHKELLEFLASDHRIAADIGYRHHEPEPDLSLQAKRGQ
jgi:uncharacterized protein YjiS (DUF1127 family)